MNYAIYLSLFLLDSYFSNNSLSIDCNSNYGLGTVCFYGSNISLSNTTFYKNYNSRGAALYIDGNNNFVTIQATLFNVTFESNEALFFGGAFYFGSSFWQFNGTFVNINCTGNQADKCKIFKI